jgi:DNA processing protein
MNLAEGLKINEGPLDRLLWGRPVPENLQQKLIREPVGERPQIVFWRGNPEILRGPAVAVVGARKVSADGVKRARRVSRELAMHGVTVVSGLAMGVDIAAHTAAIEAGGRTVAVLGTPLDIATPRGHAEVQELIAREHLLVSQFRLGSRVFQANFPQRNRVMAAVTDATVIIEASDTSGTLHQAAECVRLGRLLFVAKSVFDNKLLEWPKRFATYERLRVLERTEDVVVAIREARGG